VQQQLAAFMQQQDVIVAELLAALGVSAEEQALALQGITGSMEAKQVGDGLQLSIPRAAEPSDGS